MHYFKPFLISLVVLLLCSNVSKGLDCQLNEANPNKVAYSISVSQTAGGGNFTSIQSAIDSISPENYQWIRIQIAAGKYREKVTIPVNKPCIFLEGAGSEVTMIVWDDHQLTSTSATFTSLAENIVAKGITFKNSYNIPAFLKANSVTQAVAAKIDGDKTSFYHCAFMGLQDTLFDAKGRHYFNKCYIEGGIDFIFGYAQSIYEKCIINVNIGTYIPESHYGYITAQGRNSQDDWGGFVFKFCAFTGTDNSKAYLGRAYGAYSRVIIYKSLLSDVVEPKGWNAWNHIGHEQNFEYVEADCSGPGADTSKRVPWLKKLSDSELSRFVNIRYIDQEGWISKQYELF